MTSKIVTLRKEPVAVSLEPVADVVSLLKSLLSQAEAGELRRVAIIAEYTGDCSQHVTPGADAPGKMHHIIAGLAICQHDLLAKVAAATARLEGDA